MNNQIFLIDSNSLITPYLSYYSFDLAPGFWRQLEKVINEGKVAILDMVKNEILQGNDELRGWMEQIEIGHYIDRRIPEILSRWSEILEYIQKSPYYKPAALEEWARDSVADPWLIATASVFDYTLVTFETPNNSLNVNQKSKNPKIPDVAKEFGVRTVWLFDMMRSLGIGLG